MDAKFQNLVGFLDFVLVEVFKVFILGKYKMKVVWKKKWTILCMGFQIFG